MFFKTLLSAFALTFGLASMATANCIAGPCPTPVGTTSYNQNLPQPRDWASRIDFNAGWMAETNGLAQGIGNDVRATSSITEQYTVNSLGSVLVDPNCRANCGEQTLTSDWNLKQSVDNRVVAMSHGAGTTQAPVFARSGSASMGSFEGFLGAQMQVGAAPINVIPLPDGDGN
jgi:hypothetical protein